MLNLLHNPYVYPALVVVVMLVACVHVYRHDSPALLLDGLLVVAAPGSSQSARAASCRSAAVVGRQCQRAA